MGHLEPNPQAIDRASWPVILAIGGIYLSQSLIGGLSFQALPSALRDEGVSLSTIGLFSLILVPWVLKFLWAPLIERWRLPAGRRRRSRHVVAICQFSAVLLLLLLAMAGLQTLWLLFAILLLLASAAATADIACDGYAVQQLAPSQRGWGNAAQVGGGYLGAAAGSGLFLWLLDRQGWSVACVTLAGILLVWSVPFFLRREQPGGTIVGERQPPPSLRRAWANPSLRTGLLLIVALMAAMRLSHSLVGPLLVDSGLTLSEIGLLRGSGGVAAGVVGTIVAGAAVRRWGARALILPVVLAHFSCIGLLGLIGTAGAPFAAAISTAVLAQAFVMAAAFVALYSVLMGWSQADQPGVDFTIFQCADAAVATAAGLLAGLIAESFGYGAAFVIAAVLALAGLPLIRSILRCIRAELPTVKDALA